MNDTRIQRSSLQSEVCNRLRQEIIDGVWRPGTRLQERLLCERYGISRSPLRESYQSLVAEGLIEVTPNRGAVVTAPTPEKTMNFELLRALEVLAVRLACRSAKEEDLRGIADLDEQMRDTMARNDIHDFLKLNNAVHRAIVLASGNEPLADVHLVTSRQIIRVQNLDGPLTHRASEGMHQHDEIIAALVARDEERAVRLFEEHLDTVEENLRSRLREFEPA
ncbi:GntR family transcriptional regulator [Rhizorhabdus histidinilytica]